MQKKVVFLVLAAVIGLGAIVIIQSRKAAELTAEVTRTREKAEATERELADQQERIERLQNQKSTLSRQLRDLATTREPASTSADQPIAPLNAAENVEAQPKGRGGFLARMMENPEMKKMMREQQKQMLNMMYDPLFKELNLSPEETEELTALMLDNQMNAVEKGTAFLESSSEEKSEMQKILAEDKKQFEAQLKDLLGDDRYAHYEDFNKALPDRMALTQLKSQFGDHPLSEAQSADLLMVMKEERQRATESGKATPPTDFSAALSEDSINKYFADQEEINSHVIERASGILSPEHVEVLGRSLTNNLSMQRAGMNMARTMLGGDSTNTPNPLK